MLRGIAVLALGCALGAGAALAEVRRVEAVGAVPLRPDEASAEKSPRDAAVQAALFEAVRRVAADLAPDLDPNDASDAFRELLGNDPTAYTSRYRIVEDRGERPALFTRDPGAETEYVVLVEARVDLDRVRSRLARAGWAPSGESRRVRVRIEVVSEDGWAGFAALRRALVQVAGARSALPVELTRERAVLSVDADRGPRALLDALQRSQASGVRVERLAEDADSLTLRVAAEVPPVSARGRRPRRN